MEVGSKGKEAADLVSARGVEVQGPLDVKVTLGVTYGNDLIVASLLVESVNEIDDIFGRDLTVPDGLVGQESIAGAESLGIVGRDKAIGKGIITLLASTLKTMWSDRDASMV